MNIRERHFAKHYVTDPETKGNAEQSAIKAGYAVRYAEGNAYKLVSRSGVKELITRFEMEQKAKLDVNLAKKVEIAWSHYIVAVEQKDLKQAERWFEQHGRLCGDYVQKIESKDTTKYDDDEQGEINGIKSRLDDSLTNPN